MLFCNMQFTEQRDTLTKVHTIYTLWREFEYSSHEYIAIHNIIHSYSH